VVKKDDIVGQSYFLASSRTQGLRCCPRCCLGCLRPGMRWQLWLRWWHLRASQGTVMCRGKPIPNLPSTMRSN